MEEINKLLNKEGFKLINKVYDNGTDVSIYLHTTNLSFIKVDEDEDADTEVLLDILGIDNKDFEMMCRGKDEEEVLKELVKKHQFKE